MNKLKRTLKNTLILIQINLYNKY